MNKLKLILYISIIALLSANSVLSQSMNNIVLWGSGGYNAFMTSSDNVFTKGNMGGDIGVGYELHYKRFLFQTGVEFGYYNARLGIEGIYHTKELIDTEGVQYKGKFHFFDNSSIDKYSYGNVNIPIMAGLQTGKFYFMAGGKLGINVIGSSSVNNILKSSGEYIRYIEDFEEMFNHDFTTQEQNYHYPIKFKINFSLSGELGMYLGKSYKSDGMPKYRLGLYADYGLLDIHDKSKNADLILNKRGEPHYFPGLNSFLLANPLVDKKVNSFYLGLKFTVIFQLKNSRDCMCEEFLDPNNKGLWGIPWVGSY